jgi:hypothetical protein
MADATALYRVRNLWESTDIGQVEFGTAESERRNISIRISGQT